MHTTPIRLARAHQPLIKFIGKHHFSPHAPTAHPAAPPEIKQNFASFLKRSQASASSSSTSSSASSSRGDNVTVYNEWWEAPERYWTRELSKAEINAIMSGGASSW
ncbi:hypothetical protein AX16_008539 [Volvariella volvacea WC 439]|nr:hypothetical protein AX16_008539 [Volvariella volvacea WC 439]